MSEFTALTLEEINAAEIAMGIDDEHLASLGFFPSTPAESEEFEDVTETACTTEGIETE